MDNNSTDYKISDLIEKLANDKEWEPDDIVRAKAVQLMKQYSISVF